ncbi:hypothetical protein FYK55_03300 [Roseiconus nitratireducens]|uniref:Cytochrome c domain-containing protein n=1 Tax=Roseiconus nitratireducens TaxID=2605748 RepID=A0A5M6DIA9_9BACT|nr:hypothetical protein [Roseiconus nitratireducens]KAA5545952.1 hypothetical protein FYK55_03300 [Roseiconus nitratireducens]
MKRFAILFSCFALIASPVLATSTFNKQWKETYLSGDDVNEDFVKTARKAGCYVCHVKGEDKKKVRNEYGKAVNEFLKAEDFPKDYVTANPEEAAKKITEGLKKAGEKKSKDGKEFAAKIKNSELPATDAGLDD